MNTAVLHRAKALGGRLRRVVHGAYYYVPVLHRRTQPLLIIGHMRCGSTLLAHILDSHPEIAGYGETHRSYRRKRDLWGLRAHVFVRQPTLRVRARYVSDKNVNEIFPVEPAVLRDSDARVVLILREPVQSMSSLLRILPDWSEPQALAHYLCRMELLKSTAESMSGSGRVFVLTHHQLLHHSAAVLAALTRFLGLRTPLSERYEATAKTGEWGWGDTSEKIWAGRIVRDYRPPEHTITAEVIEHGQVVYRQTVAFLAEHAQQSGVPFGPVVATQRFVPDT